MKFRTELVLPEYAEKLSHKSNILSLGSCFADVLGRQLTADKFGVCSNPMGIIYNPLQLWGNIFNDHWASYNVCRDGLWFNYLCHSVVVANTEQELNAKIKQLQHLTFQKITQADFLILTLGTAWVYELIDSKLTVSNCHKMPSTLFNKRLLSVQEILDSFEIFYQKLKVINSKVKLVFTVSPVRHIKDTIVLNSVSKATLSLVAHQICNHFPNIIYFPAYELMMDDLRDYRFYADDLLHPSGMAEQYIMDKFYNAFMDTNTLALVDKVRKLVSGINHRPFSQNSDLHKIFLKNLLSQAQMLDEHIDLKEIIAQIQNSMAEN